MSHLFFEYLIIHISVKSVKGRFYIFSLLIFNATNISRKERFARYESRAQGIKSILDWRSYVSKIKIWSR